MHRKLHSKLWDKLRLQERPSRLEERKLRLEERLLLGNVSMEICIQCGTASQSEYTVVAIMNLANVSHPEAALADNGLWLAFPICDKCHQRPRIKAHFAPRFQMAYYLSAAEKQILRA